MSKKSPKAIQKSEHEDDRNALQGVNLEHWRWFVDYYRESMEMRRGIQFKAFTGFIALNLVLLKGTTDFLLGQSGTEAVRVLSIVMSCCFYIIFIGFVYHMELRNRGNRTDYITLEILLSNHLRMESKPLKIDESWTKSWSAIWAGLGGLVLTIFCIVATVNTPLNAMKSKSETTIIVANSDSTVVKISIASKDSLVW